MTPVDRMQLPPLVSQTANPATGNAEKGAKEDTMRGLAQKLEASFLAEMLKHSGFGESRGAFGGGAGEDQFGSFLRQAYADEISANGGIGLAEHIFESLKEYQNESL